jgi:hypothetical protein
MVNYVSLRALAERLIEKNGRTLTLIREDQNNPADPAVPWGPNLDTEDVSLTLLGVFIEFEKEDFDGSLVRRGDKRVLAAASSVEDAATGSVNIKIEDYDYLEDNGVRWKILTVDAIEPGPLRVYYDIQVRQ